MCYFMGQLSCIYGLNTDLVFHSGLVLLQANTLNVAFNSHNKALLTIMMSNNVCDFYCSSIFRA